MFRFIPAKTIAEAERYAYNIGFGNKVNYKLLTVKEANSVNVRLAKIHKEYPFKPIDIRMSPHPNTKSVMSANYKKLEISKRYLNERQCEELFRDRYCDKEDPLDSILRHEIGHVIADQTFGQISGIRANPKHPELQSKWHDIYNILIKNNTIKEISQHAIINEKECFAECFVRYSYDFYFEESVFEFIKCSVLLYMILEE